MKYIKQYENSNEPHIGQYAIGYNEKLSEPERSLLPTLIGKITDIDSRGLYVLTYNINIYLNINKWYFHKQQLIYFSDNKEDLETILSANKYNL
jgi:hypothetical protein